MKRKLIKTVMWSYNHHAEACIEVKRIFGIYFGFVNRTIILRPFANAEKCIKKMQDIVEEYE